MVVADEFRVAVALRHDLPVVGGDFTGFAGAVLLGVQQRLESGFVHLQFLLARNEGGQVDGESKRVIQLKHHIPLELVAFFHARSGRREALHAGGERPQEGLFLLFDDLLDEAALGLDFRERFGHLCVEHGHELVDERFVHAEERGAVSNRAAKDAANDVARAGV